MHHSNAGGKANPCYVVLLSFAFLILLMFQHRTSKIQSLSDSLWQGYFQNGCSMESSTNPWLTFSCIEILRMSRISALFLSNLHQTRSFPRQNPDDRRRYPGIWDEIHRKNATHGKFLFASMMLITGKIWKIPWTSPLKQRNLPAIDEACSRSPLSLEELG